MRHASRACVLRVRKRVRRRNDRAGEREFSDVRANGGRSSCNEIQPHWIYGAVSGVERPRLLKFLDRRFIRVTASVCRSGGARTMVGVPADNTYI